MVNASTSSIVFFGTGPVAAKSLELLAENFTIEAVITKPRPAHHRGSVPVLQTAEKLNLPILTASSKKDLDVLFMKKPVKSQLAVLIDFGIIVSQEVIDYFPLGILNSHFSILPDLRGADPITFAVLSGQKETGVSLMMLVPAMDEGPLVGYESYTLPEDIITPELTDELILLSDSLLKRHLPSVFSGEAVAQSQEVTGKTVSYSQKLEKSDREIDWHKSASQIEREVRAYIGWPGSKTILGDLEVIITKAHVTKENSRPGEIQFDKKVLSVGCGKKSLAIERLKPAGKKDMDIAAFIAGYGQRLKK
jgi:methionyl-tRNA formyltransferase